MFLPNGIPFLSVDGIQEGELIFDGCRFIAEEDSDEYRKKCAPQRDDILMGKAASTGKIARVKVDFDFSVWSPLALIRPETQHIDSSYLEFALKSQKTQAQIDVLCTSNTQKNIAMADIPNITLGVPALSEQRAIAEFLDRETGKIDALVVKKQRLIEPAPGEAHGPHHPRRHHGPRPNYPQKAVRHRLARRHPRALGREAGEVGSQDVPSGHTPDKKIDAYWQGARDDSLGVSE